MIDKEPELTTMQKVTIWFVAIVLTVLFFAALNVFGALVLG